MEGKHEISSTPRSYTSRLLSVCSSAQFTSAQTIPLHIGSAWDWDRRFSRKRRSIVAAHTSHFQTSPLSSISSLQARTNTQTGEGEGPGKFLTESMPWKRRQLLGYLSSSLLSLEALSCVHVGVFANDIHTRITTMSVQTDLHRLVLVAKVLGPHLRKAPRSKNFAEASRVSFKKQSLEVPGIIV